MKKLFATMLMGVFLVSATGCGAWWANFKKDPVAQTESILSVVEEIVQVAVVVFGGVKANLPQDIQTQAQADFDKAVAAVTKAEAAVRAAVVVAADAKED